MQITKVRDKKLRRDVWSFRVQIAGVDYRDKGFLSRVEAEAAIAAIRTRVLRDKYDLPGERYLATLKELVEERVKDLDLKRSNHRRIKVVLEMFRDHLSGATPVEQIAAADVLSYKRRRVATSRLKPNSINRELEAVTAMFRRAGTYFPSLEKWKPPRMPYEKIPERGRERVWTEDEQNKILAELRLPRRHREQPLAVETRHAVADIVELALNTGMRLGEIERLAKNYIDWKAGFLHLPARVTKTRKARGVPLNATALAILERRAAASRHPVYVFTPSRGTGRIKRDKVYRALRGAAERAKVPYGAKTEDGFTFHDARHTATTRMLDAGAPLGAVSEVLGHSKRTMTLLYDHPDRESKRRAVQSLAEPRDRNSGPADSL